MKKPSPSLTWRHQDTSVRTNGKRSRAAVSWVLAGALYVPVQEVQGRGP